MNLRGSDRLRVWLMGAAALGMLGPDRDSFAETNFPFIPSAKKPPAKVTTAVSTEPPRLLPVPESNPSMIQPVSQTQAVAANDSGQKSEVMKQLELLYEKDGREMPDLQTMQPVPSGNGPAGAPVPSKQIAPQAQPVAQPRTQAPAMVNPAPSAVQSNAVRPNQLPTVASRPNAPMNPQPSPPPSKNPVTGFFKKLLPGNKDPKPTSAPADYRPNVAPTPPNSAIQSQAARPGTLRSGQAAPQPIYPAPVTEQTQTLSPSTPALSTVPAVLPQQTAEALPAPMTTPELSLPSPTQSPLQELPVPATAGQSENLEFQPPTPVRGDDIENAFTEMSEEEADDEEDMDPYTGLTLDEDAGVGNSAASKTAELPNLTPPKDDAPKEDPFAEELKKMGILPAPEAEAPKTTAATPVEPPSLDGIEDEATREKMQKIRERGGMKGLKGFCPVTLHDERELVDAKPDFHATFRGQKFHFATAEAKLKFEENPSSYAPAAYGADVVALTRDKDVVEGTLDFAAWFKGRLYLFGTQDAHDTFVANPVQYATPAGIE